MSLVFQPPRKPDSSQASNGRRASAADVPVLCEAGFAGAVRRERRRSERSSKRFVLMQVDLKHLSKSGAQSRAPQNLARAIQGSVRETDVIGWCQESQVLGVIFTELGDVETDNVLSSLKQRITNAIMSNSCHLDGSALTFAFHCFPEDCKIGSHFVNLNLYPELGATTWSRTLARGIKRLIDVLGSLLGLALLLGVFLAIALLIKLTSKGPILFRQIRIGYHGRAFTFLKFRSMYVNADATIHKDYVARLINGSPELNTPPGIYKITNDPRITPFGRFLRKTSLDELPQLLNVLKGEMSLVGPRPPLPYEFEHYALWHRRRIVEIRPGLTGLWQVNGRSRTSFDDMVRLDLEYARRWSLLLDLKIFLLTPKAVFFGDGAY